MRARTWILPLLFFLVVFAAAIYLNCENDARAGTFIYRDSFTFDDNQDGIAEKIQGATVTAYPLDSKTAYTSTTTDTTTIGYTFALTLSDTYSYYWIEITNYQTAHYSEQVRYPLNTRSFVIVTGETLVVNGAIGGLYETTGATVMNIATRGIATDSVTAATIITAAKLKSNTTTGTRGLAADSATIGTRLTAPNITATGSVGVRGLAVDSVNGLAATGYVQSPAVALGNATRAPYLRQAWTAGAFCTTATNLCPNPSFENGTFDSTAAPFLWDTTCTSTGGKFYWHSTSGRSGTADAYVRLTTGSDGACTGGYRSELVYAFPATLIAIDTTKMFVFSIYFRGTLGRTFIHFFDASHNQIDELSSGVDCADVLNWYVGNTWTRYVQVGPLPSHYPVGTAKVAVGFSVRSPNDTLDIDDVMIEYATADSLIPVGSMGLPYKCANYVLPGYENAGSASDAYGWLSEYWNSTTIRADLNYIRGMGINCIRVFGALDQATVFNDSTGFSSWNQTYIGHLDTFLNDICRPLGIKVLLSIFNWWGYPEECFHSELPSNFQWQALDGLHTTMRTNYLKMIDSLAIRYADNDVLVGYDLMNEAAAMTTSGYGTVRQMISFFEDCYDSIRAHDYRHPVTVSQSTGHTRTFQRLANCVDFYDMHYYVSDPQWQLSQTPLSGSSYVSRLWTWGRLKPLIIGEAMCNYSYSTNDDSLLIGLRNAFGTSWQNGAEAVFAYDLSTEVTMLIHDADNTHTLPTGGKFLVQFDMPGAALANVPRERDVHVPVWPSADGDTLYVQIHGTWKAIPLQ